MFFGKSLSLIRWGGIPFHVVGNDAYQDSIGNGSSSGENNREQRRRKHAERKEKDWDIWIKRIKS